jgi:hypothetical protein
MARFIKKIFWLFPSFFSRSGQNLDEIGFRQISWPLSAEALENAFPSKGMAKHPKAQEKPPPGRR